jgi:hypothetical protein
MPELDFRAPRFLTVFAATQRRELREAGWSWWADGLMPPKGSWFCALHAKLFLPCQLIVSLVRAMVTPGTG